MNQSNVLDSDILVIGTGGSALRAAIESAKTRMHITIVSKGSFPSGCTPFAMGAMQVVHDPRDSPNNHFRDTIISGRFLNDQTLVKKMVNQSTKAAQDLEEFGTTFQKETGKYRLFTFGGYSYPRAIVACKPYAGGFIEGLVIKVRELGIEVIEKTIITRLLMDSGTVVGAIGFNLRTGDLITFKAKSTILATGGAGCLYPLTTNPPDATGDGCTLAYQTGAELMDMEFIQSRACIVYPAALKSKTPPADGLVSLGGRFYNSFGERYMKKHYPNRIERVTRDLVAVCAYKEIAEGRGTSHDGLYNDLSGVPEDELRQFRSFLQECNVVGVDPTWQPIEWAPGYHYFMGGVRITEKAETTVNGLFACGEVTTGIHGANRLGGNALTDILVFGTVAGKFAAKRAQACTSIKICQKQVESEKDRIFSFYERDEGRDFKIVRNAVQRIMTEHVGVIRRGDELRRAIDELERITKQAQSLYIAGRRTYEGLSKLLETLSFLEVGKMIANAALIRNESRGAHYREDFPNEDREWLKNIIIKSENGKMVQVTRPVSLIYMKTDYS